MAVEKRVHPILARLQDEAASASGATEPEEQTEEQEGAVSEEGSLSQEIAGQEQNGAQAEQPAASQAAAEVPQDDVIVLRRAELYRQIEELQEADPAFRNVLNSYVGRKAKQRYEPEKARLEAELMQARRQLQELQLRSMSEEEIKERAVKDPAFRRQLDELAQPVPDPSLVQSVQAAIAHAEDAVARYIPPEMLGQYQQMLRAGYFDREVLPNGQWRQLTVFESLAKYQNTLFNAAMQAARASGQQFVPPGATGAVAPPPPVPPPAAPPPPPPQAQQPAKAGDAEEKGEEEQRKAPTPNRRIAQMRPDTTAPAGRGSGLGRMSLSEFRRLSPPERLRMFPTVEDYERARAEGIIYDD